MSKEITTEMLLDMIEKIGWNIDNRDTIVRVDTIAHNMELQQKVKVLEKALELACMELRCELENPDNELYDKLPNQYINYFKTKAKEILYGKS